MIIAPSADLAGLQQVVRQPEKAPPDSKMPKQSHMINRRIISHDRFGFPRQTFRDKQLSRCEWQIEVRWARILSIYRVCSAVKSGNYNHVSPASPVRTNEGWVLVRMAEGRSVRQSAERSVKRLLRHSLPKSFNKRPDSRNSRPKFFW